MENDIYTVTRQSQWPTGANIVEVSVGGLDYTNPDALAEKYDGEFEEFNDPRKAVNTAIEIAEKWKRDEPKEDIQVAVGDTGGYTNPFEPATRKELTEWAEAEFRSLTKCHRCGKIIEGAGCCIWELDETFCSDRCAEATYDDLSAELEV